MEQLKFLGKEREFGLAKDLFEADILEVSVEMESNTFDPEAHELNTEQNNKQR